MVLIKIDFLSVAIFLLCVFGVSGVPVLAHSVDESTTKTIHMTEEGFVPEEVTIVQGGTVIFENAGSKIHWPASNVHPTHSVYPGSSIRKCGDEQHDYIFDACEGIEPGEQYSFMFEEPGKWKFHDHLYARLSGTVTVVEDPDYVRSKTTPDEEVRSSTFWHRISETITTTSLRMYYRLFPKQGDKKLEGLDMYTIALSEDSLRRWIKIFGPGRILDDLIHDAEGRQLFGCHLEAHLVGRMAHGIYDISPFDVFDERCQFGYFHGLLESYFEDSGDEEVVHKMEERCDTIENSIDRFKCLHGIGHGIMVFQNYDLPEAIEQCGALGDLSSQAFCYNGVFMENAITVVDYSAGNSHESEWVSDEDPYFPCNVLPSDYVIQHQCYLNQPLILLKMFENDFSKVVDACKGAPTPYIKSCYEGIGFYAAAPTARPDVDSLVEVCRADASEEYQRNCVIGIITMYGFVWDHGWREVIEDVCDHFSESIQHICTAGFAQY